MGAYPLDEYSIGPALAATVLQYVWTRRIGYPV
jgi:hypothetical protein